jgi:hypothetical protein
MWILLVLLSINGNVPASTQSYFQDKASCEVEADRLLSKSSNQKKIDALCIYSPSFK